VEVSILFSQVADTAGRHENSAAEPCAMLRRAGRTASQPARGAEGFGKRRERGVLALMALALVVYLVSPDQPITAWTTPASAAIEHVEPTDGHPQARR
jgi:hypothetical protein